MKILLTGANGYIGMRLLPELLQNGHEIICAVRDKNRLPLDPETTKKITVVEVDFAEEVNTESFPKDIDAAYYLIHSMSGSTKNFDEVEARSAENFNKYMDYTTVKQVIYLSGIINPIGIKCGPEIDLDELKLIIKKLPIINIGSNFEYSIKQYALIIKNLVSDNIKLKFNKKFPDGTPRKLLNSSKIRKLGWKPKIDVITGLKSTIEWYYKNY